MNLRNYITTLCIAATLIGCGQKAVTKEAISEKTTTMEDTTFDPKEYTTGVITQTEEEGDCQWIIKLTDGRIFETTDMNKDFKKNGTAVYFKFRGLRRRSLCPNATPVALTEMRLAKK